MTITNTTVELGCSCIPYFGPGAFVWTWQMADPAVRAGDAGTDLDEEVDDEEDEDAEEVDADEELDEDDDEEEDEDGEEDGKLEVGG